MASWSGLFNNVLSQPEGAVDGHSLLGSNTNLERRISRILRKPGARKTKELLLTLIGASAGSAASSTYKRVQGTVSPGVALSGGGDVTIETKTVVSRNTTAADVTDLSDMVDDEFAPATYPDDLSGNGGGGKLAGKAY